MRCSDSLSTKLSMEYSGEIMADSVIFLKKGGEGYYEEKKSRFLAAAYRISDEQEE